MILHIPHSSTIIPECYNRGWLSDTDEAVQMLTDHFTDELFNYPSAARLIFPINRIICDVERFEMGQDMEERFGMGIVYEHDHLQNLLRVATDDFKNEIIERYYRPHHQSLYDLVYEELKQHGRSVIVDCHSFNEENLLHVENNQRPDFCIGTDLFHTPDELPGKLMGFLKERGYSVALNEPFAGTIVPLEYYHSNPSVISVMIEVNKRLYLDDHERKNSHFNTIKAIITDMLTKIYTYSKQ